MQRDHSKVYHLFSVTNETVLIGHPNVVMVDDISCQEDNVWCVHKTDFSVPPCSAASFPTIGGIQAILG